MVNKLIHKKDTKFGVIEVVDYGCERRMYIDGACQGRMDLHTDEPVSGYAKLMLEKITPAFDGWGTALVLGGGPYLLPKALINLGYYVDIVEQNDECLKIASKYFRYPASKESQETHTKDALVFLEVVKHLRWNIVILDLYNGYDGGQFYTNKFIETKILPLASNKLYINRIVDNTNVVEEINALPQM